MSAADLTRALGGRWHGRYGMACCPAHGDRSPSLSIGEARDGTVLVKCFGGCEQRQVIDALRRLNLWSGQAEASPAPVCTRSRDNLRDAFIDRTWRWTWDHAAPARGSPVERWIRARGIIIDPAELDRAPLRWSPQCPIGKATAPAMVALMSEAVTGEVRGVHRTYLTEDGSAKAFGADSRKMLGHAGVIRLSADDEVSEGLGICEGIETGLAIMAAGWRPIWACGTLGALAAFPVLSGIECLTIFSDPKPQEIAGARACAARWAAAGRDAIVRIPSGAGDFNDALKVAA